MRSVERGAKNRRRISDRHERRAPVRFPLCTRGSALRTLRSALSRLCREETGQGIIFAAASLLVLVGFLAFVFNIGRLLDRRTKMQIAADAAAYSGAVVEANAVSAIAYINSAMSQVYYNSLKDAVDMNEAAVAAELECRINGPNAAPGGPAWTTYTQTVFPVASSGLRQAKQWMLQLSQLENAIAIVAPRLVQEEMFAVAGRSGGERMSVYPSFRMFPSADDTMQFMISCLGNGWQITNLKTQQTLTVTLSGSTWDLQWSGAGSSREVKITQVTPTSWQIQFYQPTGNLVQEVSIVQDPNLGWVISGTGVNPNGGPPIPMQTITFTPVDMGPNSGSITWVQVTQGGASQVLGRGADGNIYTWNSATNSPTLMTSNQTTIGGVNVQVNVTNLIKFAGGGSAQIGNPTTVNVGGAHIVLNNPPTISTGFGPVWISISGFNPNQFNISAGGFSLMPGDSNGRWTDHYNPSEEIWWRNRLVVMGLGLNNRPNQWEYDYEKLGALLAYETNGGIATHALTGSGNAYSPDSSTWPPWTAWFNPYPVPMPNNPSRNFSMPYDITTVAPQDDSEFGPPDGQGISHLLPDYAPPANSYYQTARCAYCGGRGIAPGNFKIGSCPVCHGHDNCCPSVQYSNVRVFIGDLKNSSSVVHKMVVNPLQLFPGRFLPQRAHVPPDHRDQLSQFSCCARFAAARRDGGLLQVGPEHRRLGTRIQRRHSSERHADAVPQFTRARLGNGGDRQRPRGPLHRQRRFAQRRRGASECERHLPLPVQ